LQQYKAAAGLTALALDRQHAYRGAVKRADRFPTRAGRLCSLLMILGAGACSAPPAADPPAAGRAVVFDGSRLITGDGAVIEDATLMIENGRVTATGARGAVPVPASATRVVVSGKTIMPAMIDAHAHIGYMRDLTSGPENYTRDNIVDHLQRYAYFGVAAVQAMGSDFTDLPFQLRDESGAGRIPDAARFLTAGRGLAPPDEVRPDNMRHSAYSITNAAAARAAVAELASRGVSIVKTWVDDRGGAVRKLTPDLYGAIIDEAHQRGMRVMVHATGLDDAKALLRAGVDGFGHAFQEVDDELLSLIEARPKVFFLLALGGPRRLVTAPWLQPVHPLVQETVSPQQIARLRERLERQTAPERERAQAAWARMASGIARLAGAGARIGVGTDGGGQLGDQFVGWTVHTEVENMVAAGMTTAQVVASATRNGAEILGRDDLGVLAPGKSADFVVLDANPLADITNTRRIAQVYLRGVAVDRPRLRAQWTGASAAN
jgi:imidazolonepropionase-like amidohydrolase